MLRGVGFIGGTYTDQSGITPLTGAPDDRAQRSPLDLLSSGFFPSRLWSGQLFRRARPGGSGRDAADADAGAVRVRRARLARPTPSAATRASACASSTARNTSTLRREHPALAAPPTIARVDATASGGTVTFQAHVVGDPSAGIQQVWVTYSGVDGTGSGSRST